MNERIKKIRERTRLAGKRKTPANFLYQKNLKIRKDLEAQQLTLSKKLTATRNAEYNAMKKAVVAEDMRKAYLEQLKRENPCHPYLSAAYEMAAPPKDLPMIDALAYRISAPCVDWCDESDSGTVKMVCIGEGGKREVFGYAFSKHAFKVYESYIMDKVTKEIAQEMAESLTYEIKNFLK